MGRNCLPEDLPGVGHRAHFSWDHTTHICTVTSMSDMLGSFRPPTAEQGGHWAHFLAEGTESRTQTPDASLCIPGYRCAWDSRVLFHSLTLPFDD